MKRFSPSEAALEGFRLTREYPGTVLAWGALYFVGILLIGGLMMAGLGEDFIAFAQARGLETADSAALAEQLGDRWPVFVVVVVMAIFLTSVMLAGVYRLVLREEEKGFFHLRLGRDEVRLTIVNLALLVIGAACMFGVAVASSLVGLATDSPLLGSLFALAMVGLMIWVGVRLSLATPTSFGERRVAIRDSWRLTQGHFWPLAGMVVLAIIFYVMIWALISIVGLALVAMAGGQEAINDPGNLKPMAIVAFLGTLVIQLVLPVVQVITFYSPLAVAYRAITREHEDEVAEGV